MRFMVIVKASKDSEAGVMPGTELLAAMGKFNEEMVKAGIMQAGEGLHPTAKGARVKYSSGQPAVSRGPFNFNSDLVAGFWLIQTKSLDEAIDWMKRAPFGAAHPNVTAYLERLKTRPSVARVLKEAEPYFNLFPE